MIFQHFVKEHKQQLNTTEATLINNANTASRLCRAIEQAVVEQEAVVIDMETKQNGGVLPIVGYQPSGAMTIVNY